MNARTLQRRPEAGFTLVELAIVMIIIGLLIGGILKGQELITNAQVTATISQIKGIDAATSTFRDIYDAMPGDMRQTAVRLPGCADIGGACATDGNGNGRVGAAGDIDGAPNDEMLRFFVHLSAADLLTGIDPSMDDADTSWGGLYPEAEIAGGFHFAFDNSGNLGANGASRAGHYLLLNVTPGAAPNGQTLTPNQASRIDTKIDDGTPDTGSVFDDAGCTNAGVYAEADESLNCDLYIRIQG